MPGQRVSNEQCSEQSSYRDGNYAPSSDPSDINRGDRFIFLKNNATERMRLNKQKVRYIFEGEEEEKNDI